MFPFCNPLGTLDQKLKEAAVDMEVDQVDTTRESQDAQTVSMDAWRKTGSEAAEEASRASTTSS